jgi:hypothetical protein
MLRDQNKSLKRDFQNRLRQYRKEKKSNPDAVMPSNPGEKMLFIPANNSASGAFQLLRFNNGKGLIFETEGDTLSNTFKTEYGNYSDGFRKAFHHETISYYRKTEMENVEIKKPCLSAVLSGTPNQVLSLIPNAEDGLLSRFMFYVFNIEPYWKDVFAKKTERGFDEFFLAIGRGYFETYDRLLKNPEIEFLLTEIQEDILNSYFEKLQDKYNSLWGAETVAIIRRLGLICFRIAMIISVLRNKGRMEESYTCEDRDFSIAMDIIDVLHEHSRIAYLFVSQESSKGISLIDRFYNKLPESFNKQECLSIASELGIIKEKTVEKYIGRFINNNLLVRVSHGNYKKKP